MYFCDILEGAKEDAKEDGAKQKAIETAKRMLDDGKLLPEEIAKYTTLPLETVKALAKEACIPAKQ